MSERRPSRPKASRPSRASRAAPASRGPRAAAPARAPLTPAAATLVATLAACLALRVASSFTTSHWLWGLDTYRDLPLPESAALVALGAAGFLPWIARPLERALGALGGVLERAGGMADLGLGAAYGLMIYRLKPALRYVGDFDVRLSMMRLDTLASKVIPQASPIDVWLNVDFARMFVRAGLRGEDAMQAVGALVGTVFGCAALAFVRACGARGALLPVAAVAALGGGYLFHFAGYDKFGPLLAGLALAAFGAAALARSGRGVWWLAAGTAVALLSHRTGYAILPAAVWVLWSAWRAAETRRDRFHVAAAGALVLAAASVLLPKTIDLLLHFDASHHIQGAADLNRGGAIRLAAGRGTDALNLLFLLAPLWPAGAVAFWLLRRAGARGAPAGAAEAAATAAKPAGSEARFSLLPAAGLALATELAILVTTRGTQGAARDWDMHTGPAVVVGLCVAGALIACWQRVGAARALAPTLTVALSAAIALGLIHSSTTIGLRRVHAQLADRGGWSDEAWARAHDYLGTTALRDHRLDDAVRDLEAAISVAPNPRYFFELGIAHFEAGRIEKARELFQHTHELNPAMPDPWLGFALIAVHETNLPLALAHCDSALAHDPRRADARDLRDRVYAALAGRQVSMPESGGWFR